MALFNTKTTYIIILENIEVFNTLINMSNERSETNNKQNNNQSSMFKNLFLLDTYNAILEKYVDDIPSLRNEDVLKKRKISECLSYEHLLSKNIIYFGEKLDGRTTFYITKHLLEIIQDIFKDKLTPLNKSEYNDFTLLLENYVSFFKTNANNALTKEIKEKKVSLENLLSEINSKILNSISALENLSMSTFSRHEVDTLSDINASKQKLREAKSLQDAHISPLYKFTNRRTSTFMQNINLLREVFENSNKHFELQKTIDHYYLQFLFVSKKIKPIKEYIVSYVRQSEINLYRNLGCEKSFNALIFFMEEKALGHIKKNKLWSTNVPKLMKICDFYENQAETSKDTNIKDNDLSNYFFNRIASHTAEEVEEIIIKKEVKLLVNLEYENIMKNKKIENTRREINNYVFSEFKNHIKNLDLKHNTKIVPFVIDFLNNNSNIKDKWNVGHVQSLTKHLVSNYYENIKLTGDTDIIVRNNKKTQYQ